MDAIPVSSSKGKKPEVAQVTEATPEVSAEDAWKTGLPAAVVAAVEALGGPENDNAKVLINMATTPVNPIPEQGTVKRTIKLENGAIREDY